MMPDIVTALSHWQFAISALLHFLFIPLTLGMSLLLAIVDTIRVDDTLTAPFERLLKLAFVMAVATRMPLLLQFGAGGSYFSHYAGDALALPMALEALSSFFLAILLFGFQSDKGDALSRSRRLTLRWLLVLAMHVSAFWILLSHAWMQLPVAVAFNDQSYRLELTDIGQFLDHPVILGKFVHTVTASYACAAAVALLLLLHRRIDWPKARPMLLTTALMGLIASALSAMGDPTPRQTSLTQSIKQTLINGEEPTRWQGDLQRHIHQGVEAFRLLEQLRDDNPDPALRAAFDRGKADIGYAWLVKPFNQHIGEATDKQMQSAALSALPPFPGLVTWSYRLMLAAGVLSFVLFAWLGWLCRSNEAPSEAARIRLAWMTAAPWLASVCGWLVAEFGKQPWAIAGLLPSVNGVSASTPAEAAMTFIAYLTADIIILLVGWRIAGSLLADSEPDVMEANA